MKLLHSLPLMLVSCLVALAAEPEPGKQVEQSFTAPDGGSISYLLYLPEKYSATGDKMPLMLFLHGGGERAGPLSTAAKWGPPRRVALGDTATLPYIIVSPKCPQNAAWANDDEQALLLALLAHIKETCKVDEDRVYLTGPSMGGYGSWRLAADHPEMFAAVVPICGGGDPAWAPMLVNLPIWVWHGVDDPTVPIAKSEVMVAAIRAAGGTRVRFSTVEHIGHPVWQAAYQSPGLYKWLDEQRVSLNVATPKEPVRKDKPKRNSESK